jgi:hypothetical protein
MSGFQLRSLKMTGPGVAPAIIEFKEGLNVVSGASNTGKSYIFHAIDFAFGAAGPMKRIPESDGYTELEVELLSSDGKRFSLRRSCQGGSFALLNLDSNDTEPKVLTERFNRSDPNNISTFLLALSGLENKRVRKNAENELQDLSFRNLAHLVLVDEQTIIKSASPLHGTEATAKTAESNIFKLLLSGNDDAALVATKKKVIAKAELQAQLDLLDKLISEYRDELSTQTNDPNDLQGQLERLDGALQRAALAVAETRSLMEQALEFRREVWERNRSNTSRLNEVESLVARFELLDKHYGSDLARLDAIYEVGNLFPPLSSDICPLCGAPRASHSSPNNQDSVVDLAQVRESCLIETRKIERLKAELSQTLAQLQEESIQLVDRIAIDEAQLTEVAKQVQIVLQASLADSEAKHEMIWKQHFQVKQSASLLERITDLEKRHTSATDALKMAGTVKPIRADIPPSNLEAFRSEFDALLKAWHFPVDGSISFDTKNEDFIVGSRRRTEQGKGSRALTHAAFSIAMMQACDAQQLPHPGLIALDSPLVTFRDRDIEGNTQTDLTVDAQIQVKDAFYKDLVSRNPKRQIIIFENEEPSVDLRSQMNFQHFTGDPSLERSGFFPYV